MPKVTCPVAEHGSLNTRSPGPHCTHSSFVLYRFSVRKQESDIYYVIPVGMFVNTKYVTTAVEVAGLSTIYFNKIKEKMYSYWKGVISAFQNMPGTALLEF